MSSFSHGCPRNLSAIPYWRGGSHKNRKKKKKIPLYVLPSACTLRYKSQQYAMYNRRLQPTPLEKKKVKHIKLGGPYSTTGRPMLLWQSNKNGYRRSLEYNIRPGWHRSRMCMCAWGIPKTPEGAPLAPSHSDGEGGDRGISRPSPHTFC